MILETIDKKGFFVYSPNLWSDELDKELKKLCQEEIITTLKDLGIVMMNESYMYTYSDNRFNVRVENNPRYSFITSDKGSEE